MYLLKITIQLFTVKEIFDLDRASNRSIGETGNAQRSLMLLHGFIEGFIFGTNNSDSEDKVKYNEELGELTLLVPLYYINQFGYEAPLHLLSYLTQSEDMCRLYTVTSEIITV